ncbi:GNAT family N-acetyltransferase [Myroides odoratus]
MSIITKFTIATEDGLRLLFQLREAQIRDMYASKVAENSLNQYLAQQLDHKETILELNDLSTQMLTVYQGDMPVGYVMIKQVDQPALADKKVINFASFYLLPEYNREDVRASLWNKALSLTRQYDAIWLEVLQDDSLLPYFQTWGFEISEERVMSPFNQASYLLIRWKKEA